MRLTRTMLGLTMGWLASSIGSAADPVEPIVVAQLLEVEYFFNDENTPDDQRLRITLDTPQELLTLNERLDTSAATSPINYVFYRVRQSKDGTSSWSPLMKMPFTKPQPITLKPAISTISIQGDSGIGQVFSHTSILQPSVISLNERLAIADVGISGDPTLGWDGNVTVTATLENGEQTHYRMPSGFRYPQPPAGVELVLKTNTPDRRLVVSNLNEVNTIHDLTEEQLPNGDPLLNGSLVIGQTTIDTSLFPYNQTNVAQIEAISDSGESIRGHFSFFVTDWDGDGLADNNDPDDDNDGVSDIEEQQIFATNPANVDSDNDGLSDGEEVNQYHTDPMVWDTDGDSVSDKLEIDRGTDPNDSASKPQVAFDQNGDSKADILWRSVDSGQNWLYAMNGHLITASQPVNKVPAPWRVIGRGDFNGDGMSDILWRNDVNGTNYMYLMNGSTMIGGGVVNVVGVNSGWDIVAIGDYNNDGKSDMLWRNTTSGMLWQYQMDGTAIIHSAQVTLINDTNWKVLASTDMDGNGTSDIILRHAQSGMVWQYLMDGSQIAESKLVMNAGLEWQLVITGDFDGDMDGDLLWRNTVDGQNYVYLLNAGVVDWNNRGKISQFSDQNWQAQMAADFDGDGDMDILWRHVADGRNYMYLMNGLSFSGRNVNTVSDLSWMPVK